MSIHEGAPIATQRACLAFKAPKIAAVYIAAYITHFRDEICFYFWLFFSFCKEMDDQLELQTKAICRIFLLFLLFLFLSSAFHTCMMSQTAIIHLLCSPLFVPLAPQAGTLLLLLLFRCHPQNAPTLTVSPSIQHYISYHFFWALFFSLSFFLFPPLTFTIKRIAMRRMETQKKQFIGGSSGGGEFLCSFLLCNRSFISPCIVCAFNPSNPTTRN